MDLNEPDVDPAAHRERLIADSERAQAEADAEKNALLEAVKADEEYDHDQTAWVELGDVELKVKAFFPGDSIDTVRAFSEVDEAGEVPDFRELIGTMTDMTDVVRTEGVTWEDPERIGEFWDAYYDAHGSNVIMVATERVLQPAIENMESRAPQSFPGDGRGDGFRADVSDDRQPSP